MAKVQEVDKLFLENMFGNLPQKKSAEKEVTETTVSQSSNKDDTVQPEQTGVKRAASKPKAEVKSQSKIAEKPKGAAKQKPSKAVEVPPAARSIEAAVEDMLTFSLRIPASLVDRVEDVVEMRKRSDRAAKRQGRSYSRQQFIQEAILEKLEREK